MPPSAHTLKLEAFAVSTPTQVGPTPTRSRSLTVTLTLTPGGPTATHTPARGAQRAAWCVVLGAGHTAHPIGSMYATHS